VIPKTAARNLTREVFRSAKDNGGWPAEADTRINDANRAVIRAVHDEYGQAWLGRINLDGEDRVKNGGGQDEKILWLWDLTIVSNFGADFVLPSFDEGIVKLIRERDTQGFLAQADWKRIEEIQNRISELRGVHLFWT
jgi:hypothetical protein